MTRYDIIAAARSQLGVRYQHQAAVRDVACDCVGLLAIVGEICGLGEAATWAADPRRHAYARAPDPAMLREAAADYLDPIELAAAGLGDVLLMRYRLQQAPSHFSIVSMLGPLYGVHAYASVGKVVENRVEGWTLFRIVAAYRFKGLA